MSALVPVAGAESERWLECHLAPRRRCWLLRGDDPGDPPVEAALAELAGRGGRDVIWVAVLSGPADEVGYALEVAAADGIVDAPRARPGGAHGHVLRGGAVLAASLLDTAAMRPALGLVLALVSSEEAQAAEEALRAGQPAAVAGVATLTILRRSSLPGAVLVVPDEEPVDRLAAVLRGRLGSREEPLLAPAEKPGRRLEPRSRVGASAAAVALLVAAGAVTAVWRTGQSSLPPDAVPAARAPAAPSAAELSASAQPPAVPAPEFGASLAYDPGHRQAVLFGGVGQYDQTWTWDGRRWTRAQPAQSPGERFGAAAASDPSGGRVLLFGGRARQGAVLGDTWSWDGARWDMLDTGPGPPADVSPAMAADPLRGTLVLVTRDPAAGAGGGTQTWTWAGNRWARQATATGPPAPGPMGFDPVGRSVVLIVSGPPASSTWSWDGRFWRALYPAHTPTGSFASAPVLDPQSQRLLLLTSAVLRVGEPTVVATTTWIWSGSDWLEQHPGDIPEVVVGAVGDTVDGAVVAFGRATQAGDGRLRDAWAWTGITWARLGHPAPAGTPVPLRPPARFGSLAAYDEPRHQLLLYGGDAPQSTTAAPLRDTWTFAGLRWNLHADAGMPPPGLAMAYDPRDAGVLLLADAAPGRSPSRPQTWRWDGASWHRAPVAAELPEGSIIEALTADRSHGAMLAITVCCQGTDGSLPSPTPHLTWTFDGTRWRLRQPGTPLPGDPLLGLAYDPVRATPLAALSQGNAPATASTWVWDGANWAKLRPATPPTVDPFTFAMSADPSTGAVVAVQRSAAAGEVSGVLSWDGLDWGTPPAAGLPDLDLNQHGEALVFDTALGRLVMVGGQGFDGDHAWMWTGTTWLRLATEGAG